jgi:hypothetical protein
LHVSLAAVAVFTYQLVYTGVGPTTAYVCNINIAGWVVGVCFGALYWAQVRGAYRVQHKAKQFYSHPYTNHCWSAQDTRL